MGRVFVAAKALIEKDGAFLALKQKVEGHELWDLPGGKIEFSEAPEETLRREVMEEVGLRVDELRLIGVYWFFRITDGDQVVCLIYSCKAKEGEIDLTRNPGQDNIVHYEYMTPAAFMDEAYTVSHSSMKEAIRQWARLV